METDGSSPRADCLENVAATTSQNPMGLHGLLHGYFYPYGVDSASNRNEYQESLKKIKKPGGKLRPARRADNLAAIY
jgi:hypothetical protein